MAERKQHTETLVGVFMLIGLVLLGGLIFHFGRIGDRFSDYYQITVVFDDASGVIQGGDVRMGGAMIGRVAKAPSLNKDLRVAVPLSIRNDVRIPVGSKFTVGSASLLGDRLIIITPPGDRTNTAAIESGAEVRGGGVTGLDSLQSSAEAVTKSAESLFTQAEDTMKKVDRALADVRSTSDELEQMLGKVNKRVLSEENLTHLESALANLDEATSAFKEFGKDMPATMDEAREAFASVRDAADSAEEMFASVNSEVAGLKPAIEGLPEAISNVSKAAEKAGKVMDKADEDGLLGVLTDDKASADASEFISNLRRHGILRYRDDGKSQTPGQNASAQQSDPRERFQGRRR
jgi:phospholipid/cholesterol/gamma-HCH transport system substrate-binding protein